MSEAQRLKERGMRLAADNKKSHLETTRELAKNMATIAADNTITSDEVQAVLIDRGIYLGNAAGSIFKTADWECVGFTPSKRTSSHGRIIRKWRLKNPNPPLRTA